MARIDPISDEEATEEQRGLIDAVVESGQRVTNMKRTLARSRPALRALLEWYPLHDVVSPFLGPRLTAIFCHAISTQNGCLICSTYFRRELIEAGEDPDNLPLDDRERTLVDFGRQIARNPKDVNDDLYDRVAVYFTPQQIVELTSFAGLMVATNIFNDVLRIPLDAELYAFQARDTAASSIG